MKHFYLSRVELHERIWSKPIRENAKELGLSDVGLGKLCRRAGIPLPPQGYWLMAPGPERDRLRETLPPAGPGDRHAFQFSVEDEGALAEAEAARSCVRQLLLDSPVASQDLKVAERLVGFIRKHLNRRQCDDRGILRPKEKLPVPVRVSPAQADRALLALERIATRLSMLGVPLEQHAEHAGLISFELDGQKYSVWVEEHTTRTERPLTVKEEKEKAEYAARGWTFYQHERWAYTPAGKLFLKLAHDRHDYARRQWGDITDTGIEDRVDEFVAEACAYAAIERVAADLREAEARRDRAAVLRELRHEQRERHARLKAKRLLRQARNWRRAEELRAYVDAVCQADSALLHALGTAEKRGAWMQWARQVADAIDPIASGLAGTLPRRPPLERARWGVRHKAPDDD